MLSFLRLAGRQPPHIFVACFPKSGSTYLCKLLEGLSGSPAGYGCEHYGHNEQDVSVRRLKRIKKRAVIQQHTKGTDHNVRVLKAWGIRPTVHLRNLLDVVVSIRDHFYREDHRSSTGFVHREFWRLSPSEQCDYIIHIHLPWYFSFLVSWHEAQQDLPLIFTRYEDLIADRASVLRRIAEFYSLPTDDRAIVAAIEHADLQNTRLNRGIVGRGQEELSPSQKDAIYKLARVWGVDGSVMAAVVDDPTLIAKAA